MSVNNWDKFCLLMWKNWLLQWRHKVQLLADILVPVFFSGLLVLVRSLVDPENIPNATKFSPEKLDSLESLQSTLTILNYISNWTIAFSPQNPFLNEIVENAAKKLKFSTIGLNNAIELENYIKFNNILAGVAFDDNLANITTYPKKLSYALRFSAESRVNRATWSTNLLRPLFEIDGPRNVYDNDGGYPPGYIREGFAAVQNSISMSFIQAVDKSVKLPDIVLQRYPYPPYINDPLLTGLKDFISLIVILSFVYTCSYIVKFITSEKEKQLKEAMKIMGLSNWLHWTAWFMKAMITMTISIVLITVLMKVAWMKDSDVAVLTHASGTVVFFFLFLFIIASTTFCFIMGVLFSKANTAATVTGLVWFISFIPYSLTNPNYANLSLASKLALCLMSNTGMAYGFQIITRWEGKGEGIQWHNLFTPVSVDDNFTLGHIILMFLFDSCLYLLIALYFEKIFPGEYGVPEKWYFPFTKEFWINSIVYTDAEGIPHTEKNKDNFEEDLSHKHVGIQIKGLRKVFNNNKVAVHGLSMNMCEGEITVLLGHNGAGKTTTMSMLTGMFPPTSGTAIINGSDIRNNIQGARASLGLCPQYNILFDELTVKEHIIFYSRLKGLDKSKIQLEIDKYVNKLGLQPKLNSPSSTLSGGMKRKLSVCVAFCGGSKVVLCDEPTSGMDPAARRSLWDLLEQEKKDRTVLLTTHFMDEADVLGDKIAIMADGDLKCFGSPFFLKKKFGVGYHLICVKGANCDTKQVTNLLQKYVPGIIVENDVGAELSYQLPDNLSNVFESMLSELEENSIKLTLNGYGISLTTLEEVFMRVGSDSVDTNSEARDSNEDNNSYSTYSLGEEENVELLKGSNLILYQWMAMILKKYFYMIRNWIMLLIQVLITPLFIGLSILINKQSVGLTELPPLHISLNPYGSSNTILERRDLDSTSLGFKIAKEYENIISNSPSSLISITTDFQDYLLDLAKEHLAQINLHYLVSATIGENNITAWFNNQLLHTVPLSLNLIHNAIAKMVLGSSYSIDVTNQPLPFPLKNETNYDLNTSGMGFQLSLNLSFAMSFVSAFYIIFLIRERESRAKLLQFVSGVSVFIFWISSLIWDYILFLITVLIATLALACFQQENWNSFDSLSRLLLVLFIFGFSAIPMTYLASMLFKEPSTGFSRLSIFSTFTGMACFVIVMVMSMLNLGSIVLTLENVFLIFPHFALAQSLNNLDTVSKFRRVCDCTKYLGPSCDQDVMCRPDLEQCCHLDYFAWANPGIGAKLIYLISTGCVFIIILFIKETRILQGIIYKISQKLSQTPVYDSEDGQLDEDVQNEKRLVENFSTKEIESRNLVLNKITKHYGDFLAVNQISVGIEHSECFGLLGVNGAGKTSLFKMLTGDEKISSGMAYVKGMNLKNHMNSIYQEIGYCPQFDALLNDLTGRETLKIFCLLRGVPRNRIPKISEELANGLGFMQHMDKRIKEFSGGNKRKLSTALALIGNPSVIYLDEPTCGIDPTVRRKLWNMVCKIRDSGKTIVLTSHSMEECEALCTKLAIMVNGEFKCIGSTQHLKNKFSKGLILTVKLKKDIQAGNGYNEGRIFSVEHVPMHRFAENKENIKRFVDSNFTDAILKEEYEDTLTFSIPLTDMKWSRMFGLMEKNKKNLNIEDYSLSQTTLEQVFLGFAKQQREISPTTRRNGCFKKCFKC